MVGSGSIKVTFLAVPGPLLVTSIVKPIESPAPTLALSGVLVIARTGQLTVITVGLLAVDPLPPFVEV